jgi:hypothetical protein
MIMQVLFIFLPGSFVIVIQVNADVYFVPESGSFDTPRLYSGQTLRACPVLDTGIILRRAQDERIRKWLAEVEEHKSKSPSCPFLQFYSGQALQRKDDD